MTNIFYKESATGGMLLEPVEQTSSFTTVANTTYYVNTTGGTITATPHAATVGDRIQFIDSRGTFDTNNVTISTTSSLLNGAANNLILDAKNTSVTLIYTGATRGWIIDGEVNAGLVTPSSLHRASVTASTSAALTIASTGWSTVVSGMTVIPLSGANILNTTDTNSLIIGNTFVIKNAGVYKLSVNIDMAYTDAWAMAAVVNGVERRRTHGDVGGGNTSGNIGAIFDLGDLIAGDIVDVRVVGHTSATSSEGWTIMLEQLPVSSVVDPGSIVPTPLTYAYLRDDLQGSTAVGGGGQAIASAGAANTTVVPSTAGRVAFTSPITSDTNGINVVGDTLVITKAGRYKINAVLDFQVQSTSATARAIFTIIKNGTIILSAADHVTDTQNNDYQVTQLWEGSLAIGDIIDFRVGGQVNINIRGYNIVCNQMPESTVIDPGSIVPQTLHIASGHTNINNIYTNNFVFTTAQSPIPLTSGNWQIYNPNNILDQTNSRIIISQSGLYEIEMRLDGRDINSDGLLAILKNGTAIARGESYESHSTASVVPMIVKWVGELSSGDIITFQNTAAIAGGVSHGFFKVAQLATQSVVMPNTVPVNTLKHVRYWLTGNAPSTSFITAPGTRLIPLMPNSEGTIPSDGTDLVINQAGRYRFDWLLLAPNTELNDDGEVHIVVNGVSAKSVFYDMNQTAAVNQTTGTLTLDLGMNDIVSVRYAGSPTADAIIWGKGSYVQVQQIATYSVVNTTDVAVNDQSTSGYFDVGAMRIQWGRVASYSGTIENVNMPAPFANAFYHVSANSMYDPGGATVFNRATINTAQQFEVYFSYSNHTSTSGPAGQPFTWFAIGLKP